MGEVKVMVPAEYAETLRRAVVGEVKFWTDAMKRDEKDLRDAREGPPEPDKVALTYKQLGNHQKNLATVGSLSIRSLHRERSSTPSFGLRAKSSRGFRGGDAALHQGNRPRERVRAARW